MASSEFPRELGLVESAVKAAGPASELVDYMVAVDRRTGKAITSWKGTQKRVAFDSPNVAQYHVGKVRSAAAARRHGQVMFSSNRKGK